MSLNSLKVLSVLDGPSLLAFLGLFTNIDLPLHFRLSFNPQKLRQKNITTAIIKSLYALCFVTQTTLKHWKIVNYYPSH